MKWKDTEEMIDREEDISNDGHFDEEQFSPWSDQKDQKKVFKFGKVPLLIFLLIICILASLTALFMLLLGGNGESITQQQAAMMDARIRQLEARLDKYEAIDEKVTRIWEQAKSFEKFEDRFDRSEASTSLRMDHLTMSLEALQNQVNKKKPASEPAPEKVSAEKTNGDTIQAKPAAKIQYHKVVAGDTLYSISKRYQLSVAELLQINRMDKTSVIMPGQKLIVHGGADK